MAVGVTVELLLRKLIMLRNNLMSYYHMLRAPISCHHRRSKYSLTKRIPRFMRR